MRLPLITVALLIAFQATTVWGGDQPAVTATELAEIKDIGGHHAGAINVSPDGQWIVFQLQTPHISEGSYELTWMAVSTEGGRPTRIADGGDLLLNPALGAYVNGNRPEARIKWAPNSRSFAYLLKRNGQTQIWQSRPEGGNQVQLTYNSADVIDFDWNADGSSLFFMTGVDRSLRKSLEHEEAQRGFFFDDRFLPRVSNRPIQRHCGDSSGRAAFSVERACDPAIWVYDVKSTTERRATQSEVETFNDLRKGLKKPHEIQDRAVKRLTRAEKGDRFAWLENTEPEKYRGPYAPLTLFALIGGEVLQCRDVVCRGYDIRGHQGIWWSDDGQEVIFLRRDGPSHSMTGVYAWNPSTGGVRKIYQSDDWASDCTLSGDRLICLFESWTQPRRIASLSISDGNVTQLYDPNPEFVKHRFPRIDKLNWSDEYGNSTYGHLVFPNNYKRGRTYPLVFVTYQSRGFLRGGVGDEYPIFPLAAEGFFVLSQEMPFNLERAAIGDTTTPKSDAELYKRNSVLSSQEIIVEQLADAGLVDRHRVAITGLSEGAAQVTYALIHSNNFAAAIASGAWDSPSSFYMMNENARLWWQQASNGAPDDADSTMHVLSIGLNAQRIDVPLLVNVSDSEFLGSVENVARLKDAGKSVEMYVFPGEHHIKWRPQHRLAVYRRNIQWLKFWLKGEEESDPVSPGQYERWRDMRDKRCAWDEPEDEKPSYCDYAGAVH